MDPVTHTLVGASLAEAGLKRRTALGTATLVIGANLPDVDVVATVWGAETMLWFRRGATHGVLALVLLPFALTALILLWHRLTRRRSALTPAVGVRPRQILLLAFIAIATHPLLDFLNVYGMRWLMPFSDRWFYGDTLFIVDPWLWAALVAGIYLARERGTSASNRPVSRPPRVALALGAVYIAVMAASNLAARRVVERSVTNLGFTAEQVMTAPVAVNPFRRRVVVHDGDRYRFGTLRWLRRPVVDFDALTYESRPSHPAAAVATRGPNPRKFLSWARFPYYLVEVRGDRYVVRIGDARYTIDPERSWAATTVVVDRATNAR